MTVGSGLAPDLLTLPFGEALAGSRQHRIPPVGTLTRPENCASLRDWPSTIKIARGRIQGRHRRLRSYVAPGQKGTSWQNRLGNAWRDIFIA
jgi:hypothetical protein